ncbi:ankyrin repeat-containing protein-like protein, partial [Dinothrombium tinctorium]
MDKRKNSSQQQSLTKVSTIFDVCREGNASVLKLVLKSQPNIVKIRDENNRTLLHYCAETKDPQCGQCLIDLSKNLLHLQDDEGYTVLHLAVINGNKIFTKFLCQKLTDEKEKEQFLNCGDNEGHTAFHWATVCNEIACIDILHEEGASPAVPDIHGAHPLHYASQMCGFSSETGKSSKIGLELLRKLLTFPGVIVDCKDNDGRTPLLWAASSGSSEAILVLLKARADVSEQDKDGLTALHCAASRGYVDCVETLLTLCEAEIDQMDKNGCSALFYATTLGHADCTHVLLKYGAEPNRQDCKGRTAAHCGAAKGQLETLKILAHQGANLWMRNVKGDLPLHEAIKSGRKELVWWLLEQQQGAVNVTNTFGRTPLHLAAIQNNVEMCKILIDAGADINAVMKSKSHMITPLDSALQRGHRSCAKFLLLHGALPATRLNLSHKQSRLSSGSFFDGNMKSDTGFSVETEYTSNNTRTDSSAKIKNINLPTIDHKPRIISSRKIQLFQASETTPEFSATARTENDSHIRTQSIITNVYLQSVNGRQKVPPLKKKTRQKKAAGKRQISSESSYVTIDTGDKNDHKEHLNDKRDLNNSFDENKGVICDLPSRGELDENQRGESVDQENNQKESDDKESIRSMKGESNELGEFINGKDGGKEEAETIATNGNDNSTSKKLEENDNGSNVSNISIKQNSSFKNKGESSELDVSETAESIDVSKFAEKSDKSNENNKHQKGFNKSGSVKSKNTLSSVSLENAIAENGISTSDQYEISEKSVSKENDSDTESNDSKMKAKTEDESGEYLKEGEREKEATTLSSEIEESNNEAAASREGVNESKPKQFEKSSIEKQETIIDSSFSEKQTIHDQSQVDAIQKSDFLRKKSNEQLKISHESNFSDSFTLTEGIKIDYETTADQSLDKLENNNVKQFAQNVAGSVVHSILDDKRIIRDATVENKRKSNLKSNDIGSNSSSSDSKHKESVVKAASDQNTAYLSDENSNENYDMKSKESSSPILINYEKSITIENNSGDKSWTSYHELHSSESGSISSNDGIEDASGLISDADPLLHSSTRQGTLVFDLGQNQDHVTPKRRILSRNNSRCSHKLHYKTYPLNLKALDLSHITSKVNTRGANTQRKEGIDEKLILQTMEKSLRKYQMEKKLFEELQNLKLCQIRSNQANEAVLVKRLATKFADEFRMSGLQLFSGSYTYNSYEKFLYGMNCFKNEIEIELSFELFVSEQLRLLSKSNEQKVLLLIRAVSDENISLACLKRAMSRSIEDGSHSSINSRHGSYSAMHATISDRNIDSDENQDAALISFEEGSLHDVSSLPSNLCHRSVSEFNERSTSSLAGDETENLVDINIYNESREKFKKDSRYSETESMKVESLDFKSDSIAKVDEICVNTKQTEVKSNAKRVIGKRIDYKSVSSKVNTGIGSLKQSASSVSSTTITSATKKQKMPIKTTAKYDQMLKMRQKQKRECLKPEEHIEPVNASINRPKFKRIKMNIPTKAQIKVASNTIAARWQQIRSEQRSKLCKSSSSPELKIIYEINKSKKQETQKNIDANNNK